MSNTRWPILTLTLPRTATAAQWDLFTTRVIEEAGCLGIEELGPPDRIGPPDRARLFYSDEKGELPDARGVQSLAAECFACDIELPALDLVPDQDWGQNWRQYFRTTRVTGNLYVGPPWEGLPADAPANARHVRIEPGQAFGTGTHATTRMCLRWIATQPPARRARWQRVLDYGCGSGILAIAAALHGAREVDAVDIDAAAIEATRANAAANGVTVRAGPPELAQGRYALVLANILAQPLKLLAPLLAGHVDAGGNLVLAGILERQADELRAAYAPWCALDVVDRDEGWVLMHAAFAG